MTSREMPSLSKPSGFLTRLLWAIWLWSYLPDIKQVIHELNPTQYCTRARTNDAHSSKATIYKYNGNVQNMREVNNHNGMCLVTEQCAISPSKTETAETEQNSLCYILCPPGKYPLDCTEIIHCPCHHSKVQVWTSIATMFFWGHVQHFDMWFD